MRTVRRASKAHAGRMGGLLMLSALAGLSLLDTTPAEAATLDRIRDTHTIVLGYRPEAKPFSFTEGSETPVGYSISLCEQVAMEVKTQLNLSELTVEWVPVPVDQGFAPVEQGKVDLICGADVVTLQRLEGVSFSIPIFPAGISGMLRADAPQALKDVLLGRPPSGPVWRASPAQIIQEKTLSVVKGTRAEAWLADRLNDFKLPAKVVLVDSYQDGVQRLIEGTTDVFFGDRASLVGSAANTEEGGDLMVLGKLYTSEPVALTQIRNDDDFRLAVDRALSHYIKSGAFRDLYTKWFGTPDEATMTFFSQSALPD